MFSKQSDDVIWRAWVALPGRLAMPSIIGLVRHYLPPGARDDAMTLAVARSLAGKLNRMPVFAGLPILVLTILFGLWSCLAGLRSPASQSAEDIGRRIVQWRRIPLAVAKDILALYERLTSFIYYGYHASTDHAGPSAGADP